MEIKKKDLSEKEQRLYDAVAEAVKDGKSQLAIRRAARKAYCTTKTIKRRILDYEKGNIALFRHKNVNKKPKTTFDETTKQLICDDYILNYSDASFIHYSEILHTDRNIDVSPSTLHRWLWSQYCISPFSSKEVRNRMKKIIRRRIRDTKLNREETVQIETASNIIDKDYAHPHRPRKKYFGEMIQMDASEFKWNGYVKWHLHLAIDDATGEFVGAWFDMQETLNGYYHVLKMILEKYGIPAMFYTDKRTVFEYESKTRKNDDEDTMTQFAACCSALGIEIKTTSSSQAKGRIERANYTVQCRLPVDLRRVKITDINKANEYLNTIWLNEVNSKFSLFEIEDKKTQVFVAPPSAETINLYLAVTSYRKIDSGYGIKYHCKTYFPFDAQGNKKLLKPKSECIVIKTFNNELYLNSNDEIYSLVEKQERETTSEEFDENPTEVIKIKKKYIPPLTHPWKIDFIRNSRNYKKGADV